MKRTLNMTSRLADPSDQCIPQRCCKKYLAEDSDAEDAGSDATIRQVYLARAASSRFSSGDAGTIIENRPGRRLKWEKAN